MQLNCLSSSKHPSLDGYACHTTCVVRIITTRCFVGTLKRFNDLLE